MPYSWEESKMFVYLPGLRSGDDVMILKVYISGINVYLPLLVNN